MAIASVSILDHSASPVNNTQSTGGINSNTSCDQPAYLLRLASQVEQTQEFDQKSHSLSYVLAYGYNASAETGVADGKPVYCPPYVGLTLYSYATPSVAVCPSHVGTQDVVGALWIEVPLNDDGSYNLANMSIYFTTGVFANSTSLSQSSSV
jgi:hypothetical protein